MNYINIFTCIVLMTICFTLAILSTDIINRDVYASISIVSSAFLFKELPKNSQSENQ